MADFTPTEQKMLAVLADGQSHSRDELRLALYDELGDSSNIRFHVFRLRKKLNPKGQDIICEIHRDGTYYRHVRKLASAYR